jgi:outer membrane protein assembly factor BamB
MMHTSLSRSFFALALLLATNAQASLEPAWTYRLYEAGDLEKGVKEFGQPVFSQDGKLLLAPGRDGHIWAFDTSTHQVLWKRKLLNRVVAQPAMLSEGRAIIADTGGEIRLIRLDTGEDLWESTIKTQGSFHGRILVHGPILSALDSANRLVAATLSGRFLFDIGQQEGRGFDLFSEATPATDSKAIFVGFSNGNIASVDPIKGGINWERELPQRGAKIQDIQAGPIIFGDYVLAGGPGTGLHVLHKDTGETVASLKMPGVVQLIHSSATQAYAMTWRGELFEVLVDPSGQLKVLWSSEFPGVPGPAALTDRSILFCNGTGLLSLSRADGQVQSYRTFAEGCASGVATTHGRAAMISANGELMVWRVIRP